MSAIKLTSDLGTGTIWQDGQGTTSLPRQGWQKWHGRVEYLDGRTEEVADSPNLPVVEYAVQRLLGIEDGAA